MTCIIGLEHEGRVYMGADSAVGNGSFTEPSALSKLWRHGPFLLGLAGSSRIAQLLGYQLARVEVQAEESELAYIVRALVEPIRTTLKEYGAARIEDSVEEIEGWSSILVGYKAHCYEIISDFSVNHSLLGYVCIGSGAHFAYGAMAALKDLPSKKRIRRALKIAARFNPYVAGPFVVERL